MTKTEVVITDIYDAWRSQDLDRLASYLPDDFCHVIYIPAEVHPLGGVSNGKRASLQRLSLIAQDFDFLCFDTSALIIQKERAGVEIPIRYRHGARDQDRQFLDLRGGLAGQTLGIS